MNKIKTALYGIATIGCLALMAWAMFSPLFAGIAKHGILKVGAAIIAGIFGVTAIVTVTHDDRIKDPYSSILGIIIFISVCIFAKWLF